MSLDLAAPQNLQMSQHNAAHRALWGWGDQGEGAKAPMVAEMLLSPFPSSSLPFIPVPCSLCPLHVHLPLLSSPSSSPPLFYAENPSPGWLWKLPQMEFALVSTGSA